MPTKTVCVTGANGFVASYIIKELLLHDYYVHGTVRSLDDMDRYRHLLSLPNSESHLRLFEADLLVDESFDEAVKGSNIVIHTACPFYLTPFAQDCEGAQEKLIDPSLKGTLNVLGSVSKFCGSIEKFLYTGSTGALIAFQDREYGRVYCEKDWNSQSSSTHNAFAYSKTVTEKVVWQWHQDLCSSPTINDLTLSVSTILPALVIGPPMHLERVTRLGVQELNHSCRLLLNNLRKRRIDPEKGHTIGTNGFSVVDVRDVARIHRLVMESPKANGERFVAFSGKSQWIKTNRMLAQRFPEFADTIPLQIESDLTEDVGYDRMVCFTSEKLLREIPEFEQFISVEQSIVDTIQCLKENGITDMV